jgi:hypothetical protein
MMDRILTPIGIEETLLAFRLRYEPAPQLEPEDLPVLDRLLVGDIRKPEEAP